MNTSRFVPHYFEVTVADRNIPGAGMTHTLNANSSATLMTS